MVDTAPKPSTGLLGLDRILNGILPGDNIVWQVDDIDDYRSFVEPFCEAAKERGQPLIYFRFASHPPLLDLHSSADIHHVNPEDGFETFISTIHNAIETTGRGAYYVFDCLSELAGDWYSDQMLGNFFMLTCPYLYDLQTITYFALFRNRHSTRAIEPISETTQLLLELLHHQDTYYVRPVKVLHRFSPTMNMLHRRDGDDFVPITSSAVISEVRLATHGGLLGPDRTLGFWNRTILEAEETLSAVEAGDLPPEQATVFFLRLVRMILSRDENMSRLVNNTLRLEDVLALAKRMIGTGLIGGKAVGMIVARAILKQKDPRFTELLEEHDNFYIGSDVFYTFLVQNGIWWVREKQRNPETFMQDAEQARRRILTGIFPPYLMNQLEALLDYFGQSAFIVRSSSLLEDNFGNSFAGKYDSVFCTNQGPRQRRLDDLIAAIRTIYASTMSEDALLYRSRRGLLERDEQMALLVMRVSGQMHDRTFFPDAAGVGFSFNPYAWSPDIDPEAGVVRLVFGLGTRAVDRSDDDYTRIVALNAPDRRPESNFDEVSQTSQRRVDYLDLASNQLVSGYFTDILKTCPGIRVELFASSDTSRQTREGKTIQSWVLTLDHLLQKTNLVTDLRDMLRILQKAYDYPVDTEFTINFLDDETYRINLVQCRPLQVKGAEITELPAVTAPESDWILKARGAVIGQSRVMTLDRLIYVVPSKYGHLPIRDRYEIARLIGKINHAHDSSNQVTSMFLGPGRWGTSTPSLGIPVSFSDIGKASVLCEIVAMREGLVPDVSLGTHFLNELIEMDMLYLALFPDQGDNLLNEDFFASGQNDLLELVPGAEKWVNTIHVLHAGRGALAGKSIALHANAQQQEVICFLDDSK